jgi:hypothetical protein
MFLSEVESILSFYHSKSKKLLINNEKSINEINSLLEIKIGLLVLLQLLK